MADRRLTLFGEDLFGPGQGGVGGGEADGSEGEDYGVQYLLLRGAYPEKLAGMGAYRALRLRADGYAELNETALFFAQWTGLVLGRPQGVESFFDPGISASKLLEDLR